MDWICGIQQGIDYIEAHLTEKLDYQDIARQAYSSVFQFQRVFHILCGYTLGGIYPGKEAYTRPAMSFLSRVQK